jgi:Protein kinase domain
VAEPSKLGRYELRRILGRGAMGVVYEGFDPTLSRLVAVKTILKNVALDPDTERAYSARFIQEAKAVARLNHPNIVQVYDFGVQGEVAYLVMEFIQGRELRSFFEADEKFAPEEVVRIMGELLDALDFAHEAGVVHRDVKPANVMLDLQRRAKLADFGVARVQDGAQRSVAGTMVGTPAFMSPEQISGQKIDRRTDIFSAGTILYQLLTGEQPFTGDGAWTVAKKIMQDDPPQPSSVVASVSPVYDAIVAKALAKSPAQRYASAKEFAGELRGALGGIVPALAMRPSKSKARPQAQASDAEVEFWRAIQNSTDPDELEFYLEQFPEGTYAQLARHKIAKLRQAPVPDPQSTVRLEAEAQARLKAEEQAREEAEARENARQESEAKARREEEERAQREALERAQREAAEKAQREAEAKARREAEEKVRRAAAEKAMREAAEKAKREAEEKVRQAQALEMLKQQEREAAAAKVAVDGDATIAIGSATPTAAPLRPVGRKKSYVLPAIAAAVVIVAGIGAYLFLGRTRTPELVAQVPPVPKVEAPAPVAPPKADVSAAEIEKIRKETEDRIQREYAEKSAAEQVAAAKVAADKAVQEKQLAAKAAAEKAALEKVVSDKVSAEKTSADKLMAAKVAAERTAAEQTSAEKAAAEKLVAEKAAAEKVAAEKAAAAKTAAAAKPGWPNPGDRWVYEARDVQRPEKKFQIIVDVLSVSPSGVRDVSRVDGRGIELTHQATPLLANVAQGILSFVPYARAFQELRGGESWTNIELQNVQCEGAMMRSSCSASARVAGKENVSVRAGSFSAWKIVVDLRLSNILGTSTGQFTYWYAEDARRFVKYQSRVRSPQWLQPDMDLELVSYTPAGSK